MSYIRVRVEYISPYIADIVGTKEEEIELPSNASLKELLERIAVKHGNKVLEVLMDDGGNLRREFIIVVNGTAVTDINHKIPDGAVIGITMIFDGG